MWCKNNCWQKQREKCSNVQIFTGVSLPHAGTRVHYYIKENTGNDETNTENTNIDCNDEAFEKPYVRTMYSQLWMYPNLQVFVVAPLIPSTENIKYGIISSCEDW